MNKPCKFLNDQLQFAGTPVEQAQCLLRKPRIGGNVDDAPASLPEVLATRVGQNVTEFTRQQLAAYLTRKGIAAKDIGGALDGQVSATPSGVKARYFVIHDTSDELSGASFPANINDASWPNNDLAHRSINSAHIFINRLGQSATGHNYSVAWRATKREQGLSGAMKGLFLHHELVQPRIKGGHGFHAVAPQPGFTPATYERLALCYLAASLRRGSWLIPAVHCVLDLGISDGHDDPQNFELFQWAGAIEKVLTEIKSPPVAAPSPLAAIAAAGAPHGVAAAAAPPAAAAPALETVKTVSDGIRNSIKVRRIQGTTTLLFKAKLAVDADGAARAYHPNNHPDALDTLNHATSGSKKFIQGQTSGPKAGKGPRPGFFVSETSLSRGAGNDANSFPDAEFVPYIVLPAGFAAGVKPGNLCTVVNLKNDRTTGAIFADTNPKVGEASVRTAINLHVKDPSFPITQLAKAGGDEKDNYVYIIYPGERLESRAAVPHWPVEDIVARADALFAAWGGIAMVKRIFT